MEPDIFLKGVTQVRYGIFLAMLAGTLEESEAGRNVWKVWQDHDEKTPIKVEADLTREQAIYLAQKNAMIWRGLGRPTDFKGKRILDV